jgi:3-carboxy-cis,cis-muconate cycloisomerase
MIRTGGAGLLHSLTMARNLEIDAGRMAGNISASHGLLLAEAASQALARHMPKPEAQSLVKAACLEVTDSRDLIQILAARTKAEVDWAALRDPGNYLGAAEQFIDAVLEDIPS